MATDPGTLASFNDFMAATRQRPMTGPDKVMNQMTANRTYFSKMMTAGLGEEMLFQDGTEITEFIQLKYTANARNYLPTADQAPTGENSLSQIKAPWRFTLVDSIWYDHEIILNNGDQATVFKRLMKVKRQKMFTDLWDKIESDYHAAANSTSMEGGNTNGADPYSLQCFITADGAAPTSTNTYLTGSSWTSIQQLTVSSFPNYANQYETYDSADFDANIEDALNRMWIDVQFEAPESQTGAQDTPISKFVIGTNKEGIVGLMRILRNATASPSPQTSLGWALGKVMLSGMQVKYISALDSTNICPSGKPKFYFYNFNHIRPVFHKTRYLYAKNFEGTVKQPMANAEYRDTWRNTVITNRREQGLVSAA